MFVGIWDFLVFICKIIVLVLRIGWNDYELLKIVFFNVFGIKYFKYLSEDEGI